MRSRWCRVFWLPLLTVVAQFAQAQTFTVTPRITELWRLPGNGASYWMDVRNLTSDTLHLAFQYLRVDVPTGWYVSMCVGSSCYPESTDSVSYNIPPNVSDSCALDIYALSAGAVGRAAMRVTRINSSESVTVNVILHSVLSAPEAVTPQSIQLSGVYPNPFNDAATLELSLPKAAAVEIVLTDASGRTLMTQRFTFTGGLQRLGLWDWFTGRASGVYLLQVRTADRTVVHRVAYLR